MEGRYPPRSQLIEMTPNDSVRITLRLPRDIAQDVIVRHALNAREWQQLPFDPLQSPVEVESLNDRWDATELNAQVLPWLLDSILHMVGDEGWSVRYDKHTSVEVAAAICAQALESDIPIHSSTYMVAPYRVTPVPRLPMFLN
jgi:hypothetical protein